MARGNKPTSSPTNVWDFLTNFLIASMNKGQFPLAIIALVFVFMVWRMPPEDVSKLVFQIFDEIKAGRLLGYIFSALALGGWYVHTKWQRRIINEEMERLTQARNESQALAINAPIDSSKPQRKPRHRGAQS